MIIKQSPLSAICELDDDGNVQNRPMMKYLMPKIDPRVLQKCASIKHNFNTTDTSSLHDPMSSNGGELGESSVSKWMRTLSHIG